MKATLFSLLILLSHCLYSRGVQADRKTPLTPEQQKAAFKLADGFVIELVASEENGIINPIDMTFDDKGRLWTQTAKMYPLDPVTGINFGKAMAMMKDTKLINNDPRFKKIKKLYTLEERGEDSILIIKDPTQRLKGEAHKWAEGLTIPQSIMPYENGCYVAHGSELFFLSDENGDGKQDTMTPVLSGFGFFDTHTMSHSIVRGPGGWMNFSHGAINSGVVKAVKSGQELEVTYSKNVRFSTDGEKIELVNCHRDNNWGYQLRANGQWYSTSANDGGQSVFPSEPQSSISGIGNQKIRSYSPFQPPLHSFRVGGTGISGLAFSEDGENGFPAEWKDVAILANPITSSINCVKIVRNPDGSVESKHLSDLLKSDDKWFRPVNIEFGPDGCLYIADWYNKIISHNELSTDHPDRDRKHGRIWRIRHKSQKGFAITDMTKVPNQQLVNHLLNGKTLWEKRAAWSQIEARKAKELAPELSKLALDTKINKSSRILALWSLESLKLFDKALMQKCINDQDGDVRRETIRSLASFNLEAKVVGQLLSSSIEDSNAMVRSQALRTLDEIKKADQSTIHLLLKACKEAAPNNRMGGNYERNFERFLARKALENYPDELKKFLASSVAADIAVSNVLWGIQSLPQKDLSEAFVKIWTKASSGKIDGNTFVAISHILNSPDVRKVVTPTFNTRQKEFFELAIENIDQINIPNITSFYIQDIEEKLKSDSLLQRSRALDDILILKSPHHNATILKILQGEDNGDNKDKLLQALGHSDHLKFDDYRQLFYQDEFNFSQKLSIMTTYAIKNQKLAMKDCKKWMSHLNESQKRQLVQRLSPSIQGSRILSELWEISYINTSHWDYKSAQLVMRFNQRDWRAKEIFAAINKIHNKEIHKQKIQVEKLVHVLPKMKGDARVGKAIFQSCLACHKVGSKGQTIAPPLDGSANRQLEHLLTAIVKPDEAIEGVYGLYYVVRKDGLYREGYLAKKGEHGFTLAMMGGEKVFIPKAYIMSHGSIPKKSFMPTGFGEMSKQAMADLVTYIKTLK
ncbi:c-type cytochrome [Lentisphaera marina]|uniref:PVC-type heme-binding CxxCH protein n=1 Tax=Lentisphaera marina TaxID=1111041 RepID=UPI0023673580|nr:PVC-type heme-binding CxxCH protein [Lentisphaera marina]MDD7984889.1 c-type cytochrome [Lentisphaera marina]